MLIRYSGDTQPKHDISLNYGADGFFVGSSKLNIRDILSNIDGVTVYDSVDDGEGFIHFSVEQEAVDVLSEKFVVVLRNVDDETMSSMKKEFERRKSLMDEYIAEKWFTI